MTSKSDRFDNGDPPPVYTMEEVILRIRSLEMNQKWLSDKLDKVMWFILSTLVAAVTTLVGIVILLAKSYVTR